MVVVADESSGSIDMNGIKVGFGLEKVLLLPKAGIEKAGKLLIVSNRVDLYGLYGHVQSKPIKKTAQLVDRFERIEHQQSGCEVF